MKIRTDFVTNSSSSSFIISIKKNCKPFKLDYYYYSDVGNNELNEIIKVLCNYTEDAVNELCNRSSIAKDFFNELKVIKDDNDVLQFIKNEYVYEDYDDLQILTDDNYSEKFKDYMEKLKNNFVYYAEHISDCDDSYYLFSSFEDVCSDDVTVEVQCH